MRQLTIRGFGPELELVIRKLAERERVSLNQAVLRLLRKGAGLDRAPADEDVIGDRLDPIVSGWTEEEAADFDRVTSELRSIDEGFWS